MKTTNDEYSENYITKYNNNEIEVKTKWSKIIKIKFLNIFMTLIFAFFIIYAVSKYDIPQILLFSTILFIIIWGMINKKWSLRIEGNTIYINKIIFSYKIPLKDVINIRDTYTTEFDYSEVNENIVSTRKMRSRKGINYVGVLFLDYKKKNKIKHISLPYKLLNNRFYFYTNKTKEQYFAQKDQIDEFKRIFEIKNSFLNNNLLYVKDKYAKLRSSEENKKIEEVIKKDIKKYEIRNKILIIFLLAILFITSVAFVWILIEALLSQL